MKKDFDELLKEACDIYIKKNYSDASLKKKNNVTKDKSKMEKAKNKRKNDNKK